MRRQLILLTLILALIGVAGVGTAAAPEREEQFVYGITPWIGHTYGSTFVPKSIDTIYLLADVNHVLSGQKTEVYYWDITQEWMANWMEKREDVPGDVQILDENGKVIRTISRVPYTFEFSGASFSPSGLLIGEEANRAYEAYQQAMREYTEAMREYQTAMREYQKTLNEMVEKVMETGEPYDESEIPEPPTEPQRPQAFVMRPTEGYVINLPVGEYRIRMVNEDGVIPDSEKKLVVFSSRRSGVSYEILPESKWTMPVDSRESAEILYFHGQRTMYVKAFAAEEYEAKSWLRMTEAQKPMAGAGLHGVWQWQKGAELADVKVQILQDGKVVQTIEQLPYYVQQTPGYALGYEIVPFDPTKPEMQHRRPTFTAFKVELAPGSYTLQVVDANGKVVPGSVRQIRTVKDNNPWLLYGLSMIPLVAGIAVIIQRRVRGRSKAAPSA